MTHSEITEETIRDLVHSFYAKVREDSYIGPMFLEAIQDWPEHLNKLCDFWSSQTLGTDRFPGTPMAAHLKLTKIQPPMFQRWLMLFELTCHEVFAKEQAEIFIEHSRRIARGLAYGLFTYRPASAPPLE